MDSILVKSVTLIVNGKERVIEAHKFKDPEKDTDQIKIIDKQIRVIHSRL